MRGVWRERLRQPPRGLGAAAVLIALALMTVVLVEYLPSGHLATIRTLYPPLYVIAGLLIWRRRPGHIAGPGLTFYGVFAGVIWLMQTMFEPVPYTLALLLGEVHSPLLIWAVLAFPSGTMTRVAWALVITRAANAFLIRHIDLPFFEPRRWGCVECPEGSNLLLVRDDPDLLITLDDIGVALVAAECAVFIGVLAWRLWHATPRGRLVLAPVHVPMVIFLGGVIATSINTLRLDLTGAKSWSLGILKTFEWLTTATQAWLPLGIFLAFVLEARRRDRVGRVLDSAPGGSLLDGIRRALGDPSARIVVGVAPPDPGAGLTADALEHGGRRLGTLLHDPAAGDDPRLLRGVAATAALVLANEALVDELTRALDEVRASQGRLVLAGEEARRRVERELSRGAEARLREAIEATRDAGAAASEGLAPALGHLQESLERTLTDVRALARGLTPPVLAERGLSGAVEELAAASSIPVRIDALPAARLAEAIEETAFFVVSEGLANVAKHAQATEAVVRIDLAGDRLRIEVRDDGRGGANPASPGLGGLADRVALAGGTLRVDSPSGSGTTLTADLPGAEVLVP